VEELQYSPARFLLLDADLLVKTPLIDVEPESEPESRPVDFE
jgi:hypothetical protein